MEYYCNFYSRFVNLLNLQKDLIRNMLKYQNIDNEAEKLEQEFNILLKELVSFFDNNYMNYRSLLVLGEICKKNHVTVVPLQSNDEFVIAEYLDIEAECLRLKMKEIENKQFSELSSDSEKLFMIFIITIGERNYNYKQRKNNRHIETTNQSTSYWHYDYSQICII